MSKIAILAEKSSQEKAYSEAFSVKKRDRTSIKLNSCSAIITWGIGHLVELKEPKEYKKEWASWNLATLPILPDKYEFKVVKDKQAHFTFIRNLFNDPEISTILNVCDVDREGSNIFYSIYHMTGAKDKLIKRLWINSLEIDEVCKGFNNLLDNKKDLLLYEEAKTRQISDWLVGMNGSRLYTLLLQEKGFKESLSNGRVQSPTVFLIYQRQQKIDKFVPKPFYEIEADFTEKNGVYKGKTKFKSDKIEEVQSILEQHKVSNPTNGLVRSVTKKEKRTRYGNNGRAGAL